MNEKDDTSNVGKIKFQNLLGKFDLKFTRLEKGFHWENQDGSIHLITANNPLSGEYHDANLNRRMKPQQGVLNSVAVSCRSSIVLQEFLNEFRKKAILIEGEKNARDSMV